MTHLKSGYNCYGMMYLYLYCHKLKNLVQIAKSLQLPCCLAVLWSNTYRRSASAGCHTTQNKYAITSSLDDKKLSHIVIYSSGAVTLLLDVAQSHVHCVIMVVDTNITCTSQCPTSCISYRIIGVVALLQTRSFFGLLLIKWRDRQLHFVGRIKLIIGIAVPGSCEC